MTFRLWHDGRDVLTRRWSRRHLAVLARTVVAGLALDVGTAPRSSARKRKRQHRNLTICHEGETIQIRRKQQRRHLNHGESLGPCPVPPVPPVVRDLPALVDAAAPGSIITLDAAIWTISRPVRLTKNLTIVGAGMGQTILDGGNVLRVIEVASDAVCTIEKLTIRRGYTDTSNGGGGITNRGTLALLNVEVANCMSDYPGGGITNEGSLRLTSCQVTDNAAQQIGGGINNGGDLHLIGATITRNRLVVPGSSSGGLYNYGTVTADAASSIINNTPDNCGGSNLPAACAS